MTSISRASARKPSLNLELLMISCSTSLSSSSGHISSSSSKVTPCNFSSNVNQQVSTQYVEFHSQILKGTNINSVSNKGDGHRVHTAQRIPRIQQLYKKEVNQPF